MSLERLHEIDGTTALFERETAFFTRNTTIKGTIAEKVSENDKNARYILREITVGTRSFPHKTGILVAFPDGRNKKIDDIIVFTGMLRLPASNERFDYRTYLLLDDVYATTTASFPEITGTTHSPVPMVLIRRIHDRLLGIIEYIYPWESAKLLEGILIGERANLSTETKKHFNNAGLTHIIAVSGFNITLILVFLSFLFRSFPIAVRIVLALVCVGFFTLLVGPQVSVLRASVFGLISYVILLSGKKIRAFSVLLAVAVGFVLLDPLILNYDVSFQLSFLAVFGLLFFGDFFDRIFSFLPKWLGLRESLAMCLAAMVFTLPIVMMNFGQVSIIAPIANIAVVPLIPLVMLGGFVSMAGALLSLSLGIWMGFPTWLGLRYILHGISWFGAFPYAAIPVDFWSYAYLLGIGYFLFTGLLLVYFREDEV